MPFVAAVAGTACTNFENPTTVIDLRVLGIMAEPSEIILDADVTDPAMPTVDPANNLAVTITPLIIDPAGRAVSYTVVACPNNPFGAAPPGPGGMGGGGPYPSGGARTSVGSAMCDEQSPTTWPIITGPIDVPANATAAFTFQPSVDNLLAAFRADVFVDQFRHIHGGFDLGMPLTIQLNIDAGGEKLVAIKRVLYWAVPINDAQMPNQTPTIAELRLFDERDPVTGDLLGGPKILTANAPFEGPRRFASPGSNRPSTRHWPSRTRRPCWTRRPTWPCPVRFPARPCATPTTRPPEPSPPSEPHRR